ncbi:MAG: LamG domain-containing protein, partial [Trichodesmium erythraeum GBRTRLIN201]|nr:LamG domain-containing protein [Trichodesmium erythraeum GBRTRLIN201]
MSKVATKNITFWNTTGYNYPGFGKTVEVPDGLGGTISITYNQIDYNDRNWKAKPDGSVPVTENRFLSGEVGNNFSLTGQVQGITATMPLIRTLGAENNYSVTLDFSKYKASAGGSKATDGATSGDTYLAISRFFNGSKTGYTTIKVTARTLDGSELNLGDWKLFNSGTLGQGNNARIFLNAATQILSGKNSQGKPEFCPTPPNPNSSLGKGTGLGLFELASNQRYVSITLSFKQKKITGSLPNDLHDIYVASNTSSTSPIDVTPPPMDINRGLQVHLPLNEIVKNAKSKKEVVDISGAQLNGKVNGAKVVADSKFGHCLSFDGVDDYLELPTATIPQTGAITISFWANGDNSLPKDNSIIAAYDQSNNRVINIHLPWNNSYIYFDCGNTGNSYDRIEKLAKAADFKGKWTHWVFTKNVTTGEMKIYLNGALWSSGKDKSKQISGMTLVKLGSGYGFYHGQVAHLRIYDRVLSAEEINECMKVDVTPPPMDINRGLQVHLPLNEIVKNAKSKKEVVDISGAQLNGKVNGAKVVADSKFGHCLSFDGVDDYLELPTATIPQTGAITISFWANGDNSLPKDNSIIAAYDQSNNRVINIHLPWNNSYIYFDCGNTGNSYDRIEKLAKAADFKGKWTHWVFTKNVTTGEMKIYLNGALWSSGKDKSKQISGMTLVKLGSGYGFYHGQVAHLRIYDRVLSTEEINECMKVDGTDATSTTDETDTISTNDVTDVTPTTDGTDTTSTTDGTDTTPTTGGTDTTPTTSETDTTPTTDGTDTTLTTDRTGTTSTTDITDATSTTDGTG